MDIQMLKDSVMMFSIGLSFSLSVVPQFDQCTLLVINFTDSLLKIGKTTIKSYILFLCNSK